MGETGRKELRELRRKWSVDNTPQPYVERTLTGWGEEKSSMEVSPEIE